MAIHYPSRQRAIELLEELPSSVIPDVVNYLESLRRTRIDKNTLIPPPNENTLLEIIHRRLPVPDQQRLSYLREKKEEDTLDEAEYQELLDYVDRVEQLDAERAAALFQLAEARGTSVSTLLAEVV
jgi:hypothetical protein